MLDTISMISVASTMSKVFIEKMKWIMMDRGIDITTTRFLLFEEANLMSSGKSGFQRRYRNDAPFSICVNERCRRLVNNIY